MSMKISTVVKAALALVPVSLLGSSFAMANVALMNGLPGDGELLFNITDTTTDASYTLDTGILTSQAIGTNASQAITRSSATDAALASFLSQGAGHSFVYAVVGGSYNNATQLQSSKFLTTTGGIDPTTAGSHPNNSQLTNWSLMDQNIYQGLNLSDSTPPSVNNSYEVAAGSNGNFGNAAGAWTWFGNTAAAFQNVLDLGTAQNFYEFASTATTTSRQDKVKPVAETLLGAWNATITGSTLAINYTAIPTPIPAAVLLFGSGLLGLAGVGRRRSQAAA